MSSGRKGSLQKGFLPRRNNGLSSSCDDEDEDDGIDDEEEEDEDATDQGSGVMPLESQPEDQTTGEEGDTSGVKCDIVEYL